MKILVLNTGSSSIKYRLFQMEDESVLAAGHIDRIGEAEGEARHRSGNGYGKSQTITIRRQFQDHQQALEHLFESLPGLGPDGLTAIGHRVVHGGEKFRQPVPIDDRVISAIQDMAPLAPLHNPINLLGIQAARQRWRDLPQVAVFDTAFHQTLPPAAFHYALPLKLYRDHRVRRYGFHGTSHGFVAATAARLLSRPLEQLRLISLHLGNGASATAIRYGKSIDTSMGMTPLEGLVMGTRSGDIDPSLIFYLEKQLGWDSAAVERLLNHESGLAGLCGRNDMREIHRAAAAGDESAELAIALFCYRVKKYIGAYFAALEGLDAVIFTGGIGENDAVIRSRICSGLECLGIHLEAQSNAAPLQGARAIHAPPSKVRLLVIPTDEELAIARQTLACLDPAQI